MPRVSFEGIKKFSAHIIQKCYTYLSGNTLRYVSLCQEIYDVQPTELLRYVTIDVVWLPQYTV